MTKKKPGYLGLAIMVLCLAVVAAYYTSSTLNASAHTTAYKNDRSTRAAHTVLARHRRPPHASFTPTVVVPTETPVIVPTATPSPVATGYPSDADAAAAVLALINQERASMNLKPLTWNTGLQASAHKHNLAMAAANTLSHQLPGEAAFGDRERAEGVNWWSAAENIGWSSSNANTAATAEGLNTSMFNETPPNDGHRQNILSSSSNVVGIDVIVDTTNHKIWLTEDFAQI